MKKICVIDGHRRFGNGHLLPAGPLREPLERLEHVDYVVVNGGECGPDEIPMTLVPGELQALDGTGTARLSDWAGRQVTAVAAIGNPGRFFSLLREGGVDPDCHAFPDHHAWTIADFDPRWRKPLLMTEKDAVKCRGLGLDDAWYLPVSASLPETFRQRFVARVRALLARNTDNARVTDNHDLRSTR